MSLLLAGIILGLMALAMVGLIPFPLYLAGFYLICKPLVEPISYYHYTLFGVVPLTGVPAILLVVFAFFHSFVKRDNTLLPPNVLPLYLLLFFSVLSFINSMSYTASLGHFVKFSAAIAMYLLVYNSIKNREDVRKILYAFVVIAVIAMAVGYYEYFTGTGYTREYTSGRRIASVFVQFNAYGEFLCVAIVATIMLILQEKDKGRKIYLVVVMSSLVVSLILSLHRGSWIAFSFALLVGSVFYRREISIRLIVITTLLIIICFSSIIVQRFEELEEKTSWGQSRNTFAGRVAYGKAIVPLVGRHPVVGFGIGTASIVTSRFLGRDTPPHNDYLRLALEVGIPCSLFYLIFLLRELYFNLMRRLRKENWRVNYPMLVGIIYFCVISITQNIIYNINIFPMMLALIGLAHKYNVLNHQTQVDGL